MFQRTTWNVGVLHLDVLDDPGEQSAARIALVTDDEPLRGLLRELFAQHGYDVVAAGSKRALASPESLNGSAVAIVDVSETDVVRVRRVLGATGAAIVWISARRDDAERDALALAGEVRLRKPFDPRALLLIVRGLLTDDVDAGPQVHSTLRVGPIGLSSVSNTAIVASREIRLTDAETRILHELLLHAGSPVARERLTKRALLRDWSPEDRSLDAHINRLRRKLGTDRRGYTPIRTVRGVGYRLLAEWEPA